MKQWVPLESNPTVLTKFAAALGMPSTHAFTDVLSTDAEMLAFVPSPRLAVMLLYPITDKIVSATDGACTAPGAGVPYFCKQTISNACGTIALLHAVTNAARHGALALAPGSFLADFAERTKGMTPVERAAALEADDGLDKAHATFAAQGQTDAPPADEKLNLHFVAFVEEEGVLWELDGRKDGAVAHGPCKSDVLLETACMVIQTKFMAADPTELRFTIMALTPPQE